MPDQTTDLVLIESVIAGNQSAFAELVKRYQRYVFTVALNFVKRREDAEEIAQDCFVKVYRSLATFKMESKFSTWLYGIVYYTSMTFLRKKQVDKVSIDDEETFLQLENKESDFKADKAEKKSRSEYIQLAMKSLLPDDAMVLTLFYQGEQSLEEIAKATGYEANTVKVKLHRARLRMKEKLELMLKEEVKDLIN
ncbi:MAG TPA: RNA polymerase sigma factor [Chitinophagales bacterium]|nr:RNA polymerase sigma factor [Chitinophagales bacterium]